MKNIAITGSYGAGKTYVLNIIKNLGHKVFSCDDYVKDLYEMKNIQEEIISSVEELKKFDKKHLMEIVFDNYDIRSKIEEIIHPLVIERIKFFEKENAIERIIFTEIPILFEKNMEDLFFKNIVVYCDEKIRTERSKKRKGGLDRIKKLNNIQISQEEKLKLADFKLNTQCDDNEIIMQIEKIINKIL